MCCVCSCQLGYGFSQKQLARKWHRFVCPKIGPYFWIVHSNLIFITLCKITTRIIRWIRYEHFEMEKEWRDKIRFNILFHKNLECDVTCSYHIHSICLPEIERSRLLFICLIKYWPNFICSNQIIDQLLLSRLSYDFTYWIQLWLCIAIYTDIVYRSQLYLHDSHIQFWQLIYYIFSPCWNQCQSLFA